MGKAAIAGMLVGLLLLAGCSSTEKMSWPVNNTNTAHGQAGQALTLSAPRSETISRGQTKTIEVGLARSGFTGPVRLTIAQLPAGVSAADAAMEVQTDAATFVLTASKDAALVENQSVRVAAEGPGGMEATEYFKLTVK